MSHDTFGAEYLEETEVYGKAGLGRLCWEITIGDMLYCQQGTNYRMLPI